MSGAALWLLQNAFLATLAALVLVVALRRFVLTARTERLIWAAIAIKFLLPPLAPVTLPIGNAGVLIVHRFELLGEADGASARVARASEVESGVARRGDQHHGSRLADGDPMNGPASAVPASTADTVWRIVLAAWATGAVVVFAWQLAALFQWRRRRRLVPAPPELRELVVDVAQALRVRAPVVRLDATLETPVVMGVVRPVLVWPSSFMDKLSSDCARIAVAHELAHVRHGDLWLGCVELLGNAIWWWYPGWRFVTRRLRDASERACDARAVALYPALRRIYAETLVDIMSGAATPYPRTSAGLHGPEPVRRRLLEILDARRRTPRHQQAALFLLLIFIPAWTLAPATSSGPQIPSATAETPTFDGNGIPSDRILRALRGLANDPEPGVRRSVVNALRDIGGEDATAMLRVMLSDRDEEVVRATREALGLVAARPNLVFDVRPTSRVTAHVLDSLVLLLGSAEPRRRLEAARVLGNLKDERSTPALVLALGDSEFSVRQAAADALGGIRDYEAVPHLVLLLADSHRRVRQSAAGALAAIPSRAAVPALIIALRDVDEHVRMSAASALGRAGGTDAMEALISALGDEEAGVRRVAVGALAEGATRRSQ